MHEPETPADNGASHAARPLRHCNIVIKGGITRGIVYSPAIREIANAFSFRNIGGTSAGAIAACATASRTTDVRSPMVCADAPSRHDRWADDPDGRATHHGVGPADPKINLEMVTTCLSRGRPVTFPVDDHPFAFDPAEMKRYFPAEVVAWMPIVVAARMSLAFPFLLSAVKLYEVDGGSVETGRAGTRECWFTDGCLTSNFSIQLFDSPLPRWPTFAINLGNVPANSLSPDESQNVWIHKTITPCAR